MLHDITFPAYSFPRSSWPQRAWPGIEFVAGTKRGKEMTWDQMYGTVITNRAEILKRDDEEILEIIKKICETY